MSDGLYTLLRRRMAAERVGPDDPVAVAELHKRLLPYHTCRDSLGYATKAEYDVAMLRLLADEARVAVAEPALREAVRAEIRQPEPGLAFLHRYAASEIRLKDVPPLREPSDGGDGSEGRGGEDAGDRGASALRAAGAFTPGVDPATGAPPTDLGTDTCRECAARLPAAEGARFCPSCGADQAVPTCGACGAEIEKGWRYCAFCGKLQADDPS